MWSAYTHPPIRSREETPHTSCHPPLSSSELCRLISNVERRCAPRVRRTARAAATVGGEFDPAYAAAALVILADEAAIANAVIACRPSDAAHRRALVDWVLPAAWVVVRSPRADDSIPPSRPAVAVAGVPAELELDAGLAGRLPVWLRGLVESVAAFLGGLAVVVDDPRAARRGIATRDEHGRHVVAIAGELAGVELARTVAHELAHCCDLDGASRTVADRERFADRGAELALDHRPTTVGELLELLAGIDRPPAPIGPRGPAVWREVSTVLFWRSALEAGWAT